MFSKLKLRKAPLSLNTVSNAIKTSKTSNLSPEILNSKKIDVSIAGVYGLPKNSILAIAFDPVQSLLAVSKSDNQVRVYGQQAVEVVFEFQSSSPIIELRFVKGVYLVCILKTGGITVLSLHRKTILGTFQPPGTLTSVELDPSLDWLIIGLANGSILFYDVDRLSLAPTRIDNLQKKVLPKHKLSSVLSIEWHPRDMGVILVTYSYCAVVYSLTTGEIKSSFVYQLSKGEKGFEHSVNYANGGKRRLFGSIKDVNPEILEAHFHPNGLHVVTVHCDNTLAFWDANDSTLLQARTVFETNLHKPGMPLDVEGGSSGSIQCVRWICSQDPELTQLLISGGNAKEPNVLQVIDLGYTLKYSVTSHAKQGEFYANAGVSRTIPITFNENHKNEREYITKLIPIARENQPYFSGNHNPSYILALSNLGALYVCNYSTTGEKAPDISGLILPPSVSSIQPPITYFHIETVSRVEWFGIISSRASAAAGAKQGYLLKGGAPAKHTISMKPMGHDESYRNILVAGHEQGIVRLLDVTKTDAIEADSFFQISMKDTLYNYGNPYSVNVADVSVSFESKEMIASLVSGDVVICKFGRQTPGRKSFANVDYNGCMVQHENGDAKIYHIKDRILLISSATTTFLPVSLLKTDKPDRITCLKMSNVGFAAVAYESGKLVVCDITRGPAVIYNIDSIATHLVSVEGNAYITSMEFAIMEFGNDGYSSILLLCGTNNGGNLVSFKIIPMSNGGFEVVFASKTVHLNHKILGSDDPALSKLDAIVPVNATTGKSAVASQEIFQKLSHGIVIPGLVVVASNKDLRVLTLPKNKLSHKVMDDSCLCCGIINVADQGIVLASLVKLGFIKFLSLPALSDVADVKIPLKVYGKLKESLNAKEPLRSTILPSGDLFVGVSSSEFVHLTVRSTDSRSLSKSPKEPVTDLLFNENSIIPPRPAVSAMQWAKGHATYIGFEDLAQLISGPNRRPSNNIESSLAYNISPEANPTQYYGFNNYDEQSSRDYKEPVRKAGGRPGQYGFGGQGFMRSLQSGIESMEESVNNCASNMSETVNDSVSQLKNSLYKAAFKDKLGI